MWWNFNYLWTFQINWAWNVDTIVNMLYDSHNSETSQSSVFLLKIRYLVQKYHSYFLTMSLPSVGIRYCKRRLKWVAVSPFCECKWHSFWPINHVNNTSRIRKGRQYKIMWNAKLMQQGNLLTCDLDGAVRRTAPSKPYTRPTQRLSGPPPVYKLGAENHMLQLSI